MQIVHTVPEIGALLGPERGKNRSLGFVPTMGALHPGHIELVRRCVAENSCSIVSIFVNPTQFNDRNDLQNYPRTLAEDCKLLEEAGCDILFVPSEQEIYPEPDTRLFNFGKVAEVMEGQFRPGHFNGVAQVVSRLFDIILPNRAYFGMKDFQQLAIVRELVKQLDLHIEIVPVQIVREESGLAMSSRNSRLTPGQRDAAANIYRALKRSKEGFRTRPIAEVIGQVTEEVNATPGLQVEYFEIVDGFTLQPLGNWDETTYAVGCIAVFCGEVRLIDNLVYYDPDQR